MKVAILYICTGKYNQFFKGFFESCEKYLLKDIAQLEYYVFTDDMSLSDEANVHLIKKECAGFPADFSFPLRYVPTSETRIREDGLYLLFQ